MVGGKEARVHFDVPDPPLSMFPTRHNGTRVLGFIACAAFLYWSTLLIVFSEKPSGSDSIIADCLIFTHFAGAAELMSEPPPQYDAASPYVPAEDGKHIQPSMNPNHQQIDQQYYIQQQPQQQHQFQQQQQQQYSNGQIPVHLPQFQYVNAQQPGMYIQQPGGLIQPTTTVIAGPVVYGDVPQAMTCPNCHQQIVTGTRSKGGLLAWLICGGLTLFGCWLCCFIPFCVTSCQDVEHFCPSCKRLLGNYRRI